MNTSKVTPIYDFKTVSGGHFEICVDNEIDLPHLVGFVPLLASKVVEDKNLFDYLKKTNDGLTVSHAIYDLYDIGFPVSDWVIQYHKVNGSANSDMFKVLLQFYNFIKTFGEPTGSINP